MKRRGWERDDRGLTLVELLAGIVIISIILLSIITVLNLSAKTNRSSEEIIDATYVAQQEMEGLYKLSEDDVRIEASPAYQVIERNGHESLYRKASNHEGFLVEVKEDDAGFPIVKLVVYVYDPSDLSKPKAQMETLRKWGEPVNETTP